MHGEREIELCNAHPRGTYDAQSQMVAEWCAMGVPARNPEANGASLLVARRELTTALEHLAIVAGLLLIAVVDVTKQSMGQNRPLSVDA